MKVSEERKKKGKVRYQVCYLLDMGEEGMGVVGGKEESSRGIIDTSN